MVDTWSMKRILCLVVGFGFLAAALTVVTARPARSVLPLQPYTIGTAADNAYQKGIASDHWPTVADTDTYGYLNVQAGPTSNDIFSSGFRFENVQLAPHQHVSSATLTIWNNFGYFVESNIQVQVNGRDFDADPNFWAADRTYLSSSVSWVNPSVKWHTNLVLPDLTTLVNAAVDDPNWAQGDSLVFVIFGSLDPNLSSGRGIDPGSFLTSHPAVLQIGQ